MDFADLAEFNEARDRDLALSQRAPEGPRATGKCLHCDEPVPVAGAGAIRSAGMTGSSRGSAAMRDSTLRAEEMAVTRLARRKRPELQALRPQGVEGLVWDALVFEARPMLVKDIEVLTDLGKVQVCKAIGRMKKRGVVDGYRVPGNPTGYRMAYRLVAA